MEGNPLKIMANFGLDFANIFTKSISFLAISFTEMFNLSEMFHREKSASRVSLTDVCLLGTILLWRMKPWLTISGRRSSFRATSGTTSSDVMKNSYIDSRMTAEKDRITYRMGRMDVIEVGNEDTPCRTITE